MRRRAAAQSLTKEVKDHGSQEEGREEAGSQEEGREEEVTTSSSDFVS
ncbi:MAG TPA: hypothetical protein VMW11_04810 [Candidatus Dormibacteraeota bacterium]|nr:hypothetical protein [Candidatus Dormibacteraeota bacterium]